jgi:indoleamine 2,3-dioxygenase
MEYAYSYLLFNWKRVDPNREITFDNVKGHRMFVGSKDEHGFMMVHVAMDAYTGRLVTHVEKALIACRNKDRKGVNEALEGVNQTMRIINTTFAQMWYRSKPTSYNSIRTFILGIKN